MNTAFYPGRPLLDTAGKAVEAHGGALWYDEGRDIYYLYGEDKSHTDGRSKIWTWGIRYYSSKDLYHWKDEGFLLPPAPQEPENPMFPENRIDRPHIIRNAAGQFVLWIKHSGERACFTIYIAPDFIGPYTLVKDCFRPMGKKAGDFDIFQTFHGSTYLFFDSDHAGIMQLELTEDCTDVVGAPILHFGGLYPPFVREAPAVFEREGKIYLLTSGMSGYLPNPSEAAMADGIGGPFHIQGNPHVGDETCSSFSSQISYVFRHPKKKDLYIALADRWVPDYNVSREVYESVVRVIAGRYDPEKYKPTREDRERLMASPMLASADTSKATYVWLPLCFDGVRVRIEWREEWRLEEYEEK